MSPKIGISGFDDFNSHGIVMDSPTKLFLLKQCSTNSPNKLRCQDDYYGTKKRIS